MPDSLTTQLINAAWDDINGAVTDGIARGGLRNLSDIMPIDQGKLTVTQWQYSDSLRLGGGTSRVRTATGSPATMDFLHRYHLDYDTLRAPLADALKDQIKAWSAAARLLELGRVVEHLVSVSTRLGCGPAYLGSVAVGGWGRPRCLSFTPAPGALTWPRLPSFGWEGPLSIDMPPPQRASYLRGLVFRVGGGPYVRRPADLTLSWVPAGDLGISLVLTEQLEIVDAAADTVAAIQLGPAAPAG